MKYNIETINNALKTIKNIRGVKYERDGRSGIGVIAQEIQKYLPEVVHKENDSEYLSVSYGNIVAVLIEGIKELNYIVDEQNEKITNLENILKRNDIK